MAKSTNPIVKVVVIGVACFVGYQIFLNDDSPKSKSNNKSDKARTEKVIEAPVTDVETQDALIVMTEQMTTFQNQSKAKSDALSKEFQEMRALIEKQQLKDKQYKEDKEQLRKKIHKLQEQINKPNIGQNSHKSSSSSSDAALSGDDFDWTSPPGTKKDKNLDKYDLDFGTENVSDPLVHRRVDQDGFVIFEPINITSQTALVSEESGGQSVTSGMLDSAFSGFDSITDYASGKAESTGVAIDKATKDTIYETNLQGEHNLKPFLTIPQSTEIFGGIAVNAILGRVPRGGGVTEPYDFKVTLSGDNMSSNGFVVPNLKETIWRGTAIGDPSLSCVRGNIYAVTFIFDDGTIGHVHDGTGNQFKDGDVIATIRDERGNCVAGELHGNEASYIAAQAFAEGIAAAGDGVTQSQYDSVNSGSGVGKTFSGDLGTVLGGTVASGLGKGLSETASERYASVYNVIAVAPGTAINIDVKQQIAIDYKTGSRKVSYEFQNSSRITRLD